MKKLLVIIIIISFCQSIFSQNKTIETSGDVLLFALPITALGSSIIAGDGQGTWQFAKGFLVNETLTIALKLIVKKQRPNNENNNAFPSGHTSTTFQSASFIQKRYGWEYGIPAYILAGFTGYSRINAEKHDIYDVLAGAVVGIGSSYLFTTPYQQEHMELTFSNGEGIFLLGFKYTF
jgi:membrane-associated phospholipid phosphatase